MNTTELALLDDWNEQEIADFVADFVRRERRLPGYPDFTADRPGEVALSERSDPSMSRLTLLSPPRRGRRLSVD